MTIWSVSYTHLDVYKRQSLLNPASFDQAIAELCPTLPHDPLAQSEPTAAPEGDAALLDRLLGQTPEATPLHRRLTDPGTAAIQTLLQTVVQPHIVRTDPHQPAWVAAMDAAIGEQMRAILRLSLIHI